MPPPSAATTAAPFHGIRFKSFEAPTRRRGLRTLALFLEELAGAGSLPEGFVVTLPKVTSVEQVEAMVLAASRLEEALGLGPAALRFEIQVETPQAILGPDGTALVARMVHAAAGRCTGLHYGTYDYSASCGIAAQFQSMEHPVADYAKAVMQVAAAGTGVRLSDGSTNVLPVGGPEAVRAGWALHHRLVRRSLERGYYQGWDLHPAQLPTRYAAVFAFYRDGLAQAADRLRRYVERTDSGFLDEPATARALADFILRGVDCGAVGAAEAQATVGARRCGPGGAGAPRGRLSRRLPWCHGPDGRVHNRAVPRRGQPPEHVGAAADALVEAGLAPELGPFGTSVTGGAERLLPALERAMEAAFASGATRFTLQVGPQVSPGDGR